MPSTPPSSNISSSPTPRVSSPLSSTATPGRTLVPLPQSDDDAFEFPEPQGRARGAAASTTRHRHTPSNSTPSLTVTSSPASADSPLPAGLVNFGTRSRSSSPSVRASDAPRRGISNEASNLLPAIDSSPLSSSWWGERSNSAKWWEGSPTRQRSMAPEEKQAWEHTRERIAVAARSVLGVTSGITHELLSVGVDFLEFAPVPGLATAARTLLQIWDAVENVDLNTLTCLRLAERCAETLLSVRQEVHTAGDSVTQELQAPISKLQGSFEAVHKLLVKESRRPFLKRYLKREEVTRDIAACDADLRAAVEMFSLSVSIRILRQTQESEKKRQADMRQLLDAMAAQRQQPQQPAPENALMLTGVPITTSPPLSPHSQISQTTIRQAGPSTQPAPELNELQCLQSAQDIIDLEQDSEALRQLMRRALQTTSDAEMLDILQIKRPEMPEAIKTLQRALERVIEREGEGESPPVAVKPQPFLVRNFSLGRGDKAVGSGRTLTLESLSSSSSGSGPGKDTLDREFMESGIDALRRMSRGVETNLPSWTITKYEVDRDQKIGMGFFSDVYKGTWRGRTVAIKVLAETTPREVFKREVTIWKTLNHPNVLELYGASSTAGDPPWFFVSPYEKNGSLVQFLKRIRTETMSPGKSPHHSSTNPTPHSSAIKGERAPTFPIWHANSDQHPLGSHSPTRDTEYQRSRDLYRFIYEIAKGMEYLHKQNVLHGDLKASNVLVDNNLRCVISDFGQSEMKSEISRLSGSVPLRGTLRWQAPELMKSAASLTQETDVYAYAICCVEVLTWGTVPWAYADDEAVRRFVLDQNERPALPIGSKHVTPALRELIRGCWDKDPTQRPPFSRIVSQMKKIRNTVGGFLEDTSSPLPRLLPEAEPAYRLRPSPDMRPIPLEPSPQPDLVDLPSNTTARGETSVPLTGIQFPEPVFFTPTSSRGSSILIPTSDDSESEEKPYHSSPREDDLIAQTKNERRYRLTLTHKFHPSLVLPLWDPTPVDLGAVGYLCKSGGTFITLFNAFHPQNSPHEAVRALSSIAGYGTVATGSQRVTKKNNLLDMFVGILTSRSKNNGKFSQPVSRRYTYELKAGHKAAFLCVEKHEYRYMTSDDQGNLDAPKRWFKANADAIIKIFGAHHHIQREDLFFVVGTLRAPNYALFVSHNHPEGHTHFNVFASPKDGQPWGIFTTDSEYDGEGPSIHAMDESASESASKVSTYAGPWDTVLLARLRFKPDCVEPTTL